MREIKFRAFYDGTMLYDVIRVDEGLYWGNGVCIDLLAFMKERKPVLLECIGAPDIDGIDIYEGDILKDDWDRILLVEWYAFGFSFKALTKTNFSRTTDIYQWFSTVSGVKNVVPKIIGNMFENPELMVQEGDFDL